MILAGIRTFSFVDYPKHISAVVYTGGCNFRCKWCHNWKIAYSNDYNSISEEKIIDKLSALRKRLNAVCVTGGEPTIHNDLPEFISKIKELGYLIKLDTNGTNPEIVEELISKNLIDYVAMDVKAKPENYCKLINVQENYWNTISRTINILRSSNIDYEFRMTYVPNLSTEEDIEFFEEFLKEDEKGYVTIANSTEIFKIKNNKKIELKKSILR
ncbi:ribonucleoside-triphosphate reductase [Marinitoga sp. 1197]|uniref:anaerobic ribonucleoside-triphosphate reductase activating protein n=1 Tax=Marinitoga sp. 1197 TaxID=1428449 RepID=UPI000641110F|nr:anaerobic ribonucleoside-triphosphate reductase activating protein [Marinitoga sp. 1197]KLO20985.1 ribonucleoside-triphosphate reductase [Marinitoga sp. 1197]